MQRKKTNVFAEDSLEAQEGHEEDASGASPRANRSPRASRSRETEQKPAAKRFIRPTKLRIIGGTLRRRGVVYHGDLMTRPMKDNIRENLFNILGDVVRGAFLWDLFAGTGILAIEGISRGASAAICCDLSRSSTSTIRKSAAELGIERQMQIVTGDAFRLIPERIKDPASNHWIAFFCPPYELWSKRFEELVRLIEIISLRAPAGSYVVCEMDQKFATEQLPAAVWDYRRYGNTQLAIAEMSTIKRPEKRKDQFDATSG